MRSQIVCIDIESSIVDNRLVTKKTDSASPKRRFRRHRIKILTVMALLSVFVADVVGTAVLQAAGIHTPHARVEASYRRMDPIYHHDLRANINSYDGRWGHLSHTVNTNSLGFKDAEVRDIEPIPTSKRVLLIGDSFTEGVGIPFQKTFAGLLSESWRERDVEVLNAACSTYSPIIYLRKIRYLVEQKHLRFDHLVVCLDMSDIVDEAKLYELDDNGNVVGRIRDAGAAWKKFIAERTILMNGIRTLIRNMKADKQRTTEQIVGHERSSWTVDENVWNKYGEKGLQLADQNLDALWKYVGDLGVSMTLVVYPWPGQIQRMERDCKQRTHWAAWSKARKIHFLDLFPAFLDAGPADRVIDDYFIPGDVHWNAKGHELVARELLQRLRL